MTRTVKADVIRILLVDDHPIVRYGLRQLIELEEDMTICGEAEDADGGAAAVGDHRPDVVILDISMPGRSGIELARDLSARYPDMALLVLSIHDEPSYVERALKAGARGYVAKHEAPRLIVSAIRRVLAGDIFVPERMASKLLDSIVVRKGAGCTQDPVTCLSTRELEILEMTGRGMGTKVIADALHRSINTVETHKRRMKEKLGVDTAAELAAFATRWISSL